MKVGKILLLLIAQSFFLAGAFGQDIKVSFIKIPVISETPETGVYVDLVKAMGKHYSSGKILITSVTSSSRAINNVVTGAADVTLSIQNPAIPLDKVGYVFSAESVEDVPFCIYSKKAIDIKNLTGLRIATDIGHVDFFPEIKNLIKTDSEEVALKKLEADQLDAYVFSAGTVDPVLVALGYKDISRKLYKSFPVKFIFQKNDSGKTIERILTPIIKEMKASGEWEKIIGPPYDITTSIF